MEYAVEVIPPQAGEPVFEIREPGYDIARKPVYNRASVTPRKGSAG